MGRALGTEAIAGGGVGAGSAGGPEGAQLLDAAHRRQTYKADI